MFWIIMHCYLDKDAAFCYTCMSAEIKGLKAIYRNKHEAFITRGYRSNIKFYQKIQ